MLIIMKLLYILAAVVFILAVIIGKLFIFNKKSAAFISDYCACMGFSIAIYTLLSCVFVFILPDVYSKMVMLFFGTSPFLIGFLATYNTQKFFTVLQIVIMGLSIFYLI